jgi:small subunit ribosomal protein S2
VRLYARGIADAVLDGRSQTIKEIVSDEFVEVDSTEEQATA